jgi:putative methyltransferase (TIGR04325 family)
VKSFLKIICPPVLQILYKKIFSKKYFIRGFNDWETAVKNTTTYNAEEIFSKTLDSARKVRDELAVYERDSVLFEEIQYDWQLLASLLLIAKLKSNRLNVVDYGGALGTSYRQNKKFLDMLDCPVKWIVVEQSRFVQIGKSEFENEVLLFADSLSQLNFDIDLVLLGGSICYFEEPYKALDEILEVAPKFILITRTPFSDLLKDSLSLQIVPPSIYNASYPIWTFSKENFKGYLSSAYDLIEEWEDGLQADADADAMGMLFRLKP